MKSIKLLILTYIFAYSATICKAQELFHPTMPARKHEVRAVWLTTLWGLDWPKTKAVDADSRERQKEELRQILDKLKKCGINTIFLQTRVRGSVIYPSRIEPWDIALTGKFDKDPGYDPLAFAVGEAHARGMELHAWVVAVPSFKVANARQMGRKCLLKTHPSLLKKLLDTYYLDPGLPGTAEYIADICKEIASNYDVDGIHFDYIRYPEFKEPFPDASTYRKYGRKQKKDDWRRDNVTRIASTAYKAVKAIKPWVRMSCAPVGKYSDLQRYSAYGWDAYTTVHQDAQRWLRDGIMDMLCPMMYFQGNHFFPFAANWQEESYGRTIVPGLGIYFLSPKEKDWDFGIIQRELCFIRQLGIQGQAYFRSEFLTDNHKGILDYLRRTYYPHPALMPPMTWQDSIPPSRPNIIQCRRTNGITMQIAWEEQEKDCGGCSYAIYCSDKPVVDTSNPENLVCVTRETSYTYNLLTATLCDLHFCITAIDRCGNESEPAYP